MTKYPAFIRPEDLEQTPIERAETLPSSCYTNPEMLLFENREVFSKNWQLVGHTHQLRDPGSSICTNIADNPIIVVNDNGTIRAFYNVCRHRGGPLGVKYGTKSMLQCQYHGWTYKTDGSLRGVPQFNYVELFDKKDFGLKPVATDIWEGLIFVNLGRRLHQTENNETELNISDAASAKLSDVVKGISERIKPINLAEMKYHTRTVDLINCNWKVYIDNYLEGYHIPIVHPELAKLLDYSKYVTETSTWYSLQHSPFASDDSENPYQAENGEAWYYFIFPNIMLNILPGRLQTNIIEPVGHDKCRVIFDFFYTDVNKALSSGMIESDLEYSAKVQQEDIEICEAVQRGLRSVAYDKGRYSVERELGVYHFHQLIKDVIRKTRGAGG